MLLCGEEIGLLPNQQVSRNRCCSLNEFSSLRSASSGGCCSFSARPREQIIGSEEVPPEHTSEHAEQHDQSVLRCLSSILQMDGLPPHTHEAASMPLTLGGLGIGRCSRIQHTAHWGNWADCLRKVKHRHPQVAADVIRSINMTPVWPSTRRFWCDVAWVEVLPWTVLRRTSALSGRPDVLVLPPSEPSGGVELCFKIRGMLHFAPFFVRPFDLLGCQTIIIVRVCLESVAGRRIDLTECQERHGANKKGGCSTKANSTWASFVCPLFFWMPGQ